LWVASSSPRVSSAVDDHDGGAGARCPLHETQAAHHRQGGAGHQQRPVGAQGVDRLVATGDPVGRDVLAEEDDVRLEHAPTVAVRDHEVGRRVQVDVTVRAHGGVSVPVHPVDVERVEPCLQRCA
jgi:hypothetical protein